MHKKLYHLKGVIKKTKKEDDIFCVATSEEDAIARSSGFAENLAVMYVKELGPNWNSN